VAGMPCLLKAEEGLGKRGGTAASVVLVQKW
jgi:hypothetical protein